MPEHAGSLCHPVAYIALVVVLLVYIQPIRARDTVSGQETVYLFTNASIPVNGTTTGASGSLPQGESLDPSIRRFYELTDAITYGRVKMLQHLTILVMPGIHYIYQVGHSELYPINAILTLKPYNTSGERPTFDNMPFETPLYTNPVFRLDFNTSLILQNLRFRRFWSILIYKVQDQGNINILSCVFEHFHIYVLTSAGAATINVEDSLFYNNTPAFRYNSVYKDRALIYLLGSQKLSVTNSHFRFNTVATTRSSGGIIVSASIADIVVENTEVRSTHGPVIIGGAANVIVRNSQFSSNYPMAAAPYMISSESVDNRGSLAIIDSTLSNNDDFTDLILYQGMQLVIQGCEIKQNRMIQSIVDGSNLVPGSSIVISDNYIATVMNKVQAIDGTMFSLRGTVGTDPVRIVLINNTLVTAPPPPVNIDMAPSAMALGGDVVVNMTNCRIQSNTSFARVAEVSRLYSDSNTYCYHAPGDILKDTPAIIVTNTGRFYSTDDSYYRTSGGVESIDHGIEYGSGVIIQVQDKGGMKIDRANFVIAEMTFAIGIASGATLDQYITNSHFQFTRLSAKGDIDGYTGIEVQGGGKVSIVGNVFSGILSGSAISIHSSSHSSYLDAHVYVGRNIFQGLVSAWPCDPRKRLECNEVDAGVVQVANNDLTYGLPNVVIENNDFVAIQGVTGVRCTSDADTYPNITSVGNRFSGPAGNIFQPSAYALNRCNLHVVSDTMCYDHNSITDPLVGAISCNVTRFSPHKRQGIPPPVISGSFLIPAILTQDTACNITANYINGTAWPTYNPAYFSPDTVNGDEDIDGRAQAVFEILVCPGQTHRITPPPSVIVNFTVSTACLASQSGNYTVYLQERLAAVPSATLPSCALANGESPVPPAPFTLPLSGCSSSNTRSLEFYSPTDNEIVRSKGTEELELSDSSVSKTFQSEAHDYVFELSAGSHPVMTSLTLTVQESSLDISRTLISPPTGILGFLVVGRSYNWKATFQDEYSRKVRVPKGSKMFMVFQIGSTQWNVDPDSFGAENVVFHTTVKHAGDMSAQLIVDENASPSVHMPAVWLGWIIIVPLAALLFIIAPTSLYIYRRVRRKRLHLLRNQKELEQKLLSVEQRDIDQAHRRFLQRFEQTRMPCLVYIDHHGHAYGVCEAPGHWHVLYDTKSETPVTGDDLVTISDYMQQLAVFIRDFPPSAGESHLTSLLQHTLPWYDFATLSDLTGSTVTRTDLDSMSSTASVSIDSGLFSIHHSVDSRAPDPVLGGRGKGKIKGPGKGRNSSRGFNPDITVSSAIAAIVQRYLLGNFGHTHTTASSLRRTRLEGKGFCWACPFHTEAENLSIARPYDLSLGLLACMSPAASQGHDGYSFFDITVPPQWESSPVHTPQGEIIHAVMKEICRSSEGQSLQVTKIRVIQNPNLVNAFKQRDRILNIESRTRLRRQWPQRDLEIRKQVHKVLRSHLERIVDETGSPAWGPSNLDMVFHAVNGGEELINSIAHTGFLSLSVLNTGWYGRGVYFTHSPRYAEYYAPGSHSNVTPLGERMLMLSWVTLGQAYPVIDRLDRVTDREHEFHAGYPGHDSHYTIVRYGGAPAAKDLTAEDSGFIQQGVFDLDGRYDEVVVWQENQILPQFVVYYR